MEISKSTPYVRYRENISSTLHKGTIHIESEYLDRERKTTIESIEGQTWQNMVNGENKEEDVLPRLGLKIEGNEDVLDTVEQHMPIDTIIGDVEPVANEDGTYTYEISTMEGSYAKTLDGENNFSLTSDGLVGDMYIKYNAQGEEVNGNIVMNGQSSYTIENSNTGEIKNAILKGQMLVNLASEKTKTGAINLNIMVDYLKPNTQYTVIFNYISDNPINGRCSLGNVMGVNNISFVGENGLKKVLLTTPELTSSNYRLFIYTNNNDTYTVDEVMVIEGNHTDVDIPYFTGMQSVENPTVITSNSPVQFGKGGRL